jgi:hypothetical protein
VERLAVESGGWVRYHNIRLRFSPDATTGRWLLREVAAADGDYLSATRLTKVPLADIEAIVNTDARIRSEMVADADISAKVVAASVSIGSPHVRGVNANYRLKKPPGPAGLDDAFLQKVGDAYAAACQRQEAPCKTIAKDVCVSPRSVQRWVYEARKRHIMPQARAKGARG